MPWAYPDICQKINEHIQALCDAGVALSFLSICSIMVAFIEHDAPPDRTRTFGLVQRFKVRTEVQDRTSAALW